MLALPEEYIGSLCEIKSLANDLLAVGRIIKTDHEALEITATEGERLFLLEYRLPIKIFVHNSKLGSTVLVGITYLSTENFMRAEEVRPLQNFERRGAFRVNLNVTGTLTPLLSEKQQAELDLRIAEASPEEAEQIEKELTTEVRIADVSLTGARVISRQPLRLGAKYYLEFIPLNVPMEFCIEIQRHIRETNGEHHYGCSFFDFTEKQLDVLCKDLFQLQRLEKNRRRMSPLTL